MRRPAVTEAFSRSCTAFEGLRLLRSGPLPEVALAVKDAVDRGGVAPILVFDDATGRVVDLDLRGTAADIVARLSPPPAPADPAVPQTVSRGRGRPRLGVVAREVTLLPRHWDWLAEQPGGASVALRKLVDEARRQGGGAQARRVAQETAYRVMSALAGDLPGFEEATRALFADDPARFTRQVADWPSDIRTYATRLAFDRTDWPEPGGP